MVAPAVRISGAGIQRVLRGQHDLRPPLPNELPDNPFARPVRIVIRRVDEIAPGLDEGLEDLSTLLL